MDQEIEEWTAKKHVPGLAACIVHGDAITWSNGYGLANIAKNVPFSPDESLCHIASITKTITATAIMQLRDKGHFKLDDDVNDYLPFPVRNPQHPDTPITFRHLLTHSSSINDREVIYSLYTPGDPSTSLAQVTTDYFARNGKLWSRKNFRKRAPGSKYRYANMGFTLLGYLVERLSGQPLEDYLRDNIYSVLNMHETSFYIAKLDQDRLACPYTYTKRIQDELCSGDGDGNLLPPGCTVQIGYNEHAQYSYPTLADGMVRTSVTQLANFMIAMMNGGRFEGAQLLRPETVDEMLTGEDEGLGWIRSGNYWGHDGGDPGCSTELWFDPKAKIGFIAFANTDEELKKVKRLLRSRAEQGAG